MFLPHWGHSCFIEGCSSSMGARSCPTGLVPISLSDVPVSWGSCPTGVVPTSLRDGVGHSCPIRLILTSLWGVPAPWGMIPALLGSFLLHGGTLPPHRTSLPHSLADCHVHSHHAPSCGAPGPQLPPAPGRGLHRLRRQTPREGGTEGFPHVRVREEVGSTGFGAGLEVGG